MSVPERFDPIAALRQVRDSRTLVLRQIALLDTTIAALEPLAEAERSALEACPRCESRENRSDLGGNLHCFHCACGFLECCMDVCGYVHREPPVTDPKGKEQA